MSIIDKLKKKGRQINWSSLSKEVSDLMGTIQNFEDVNPFSKGAVLIRVGRHLMSIWDIMHSVEDLWNKALPFPEGDFAFDLFPVSEKKSNDDCVYQIVNIENNLLIRYKYSGHHEWTACRFLGDASLIEKEIKKKIAEKYSKFVCLNVDKNNLSTISGIVEVKSALIDELEQEIKLFLNKGKSRSILLYGPPGTGKSSAVRNLGSRLGSIMEIRGLTHLNIFNKTASISSWVSLFRPAVVLIDDIDHSGGDHWLNLLETIRRKGVCILGTANKIHTLDSALIRPGRFDRIISVTKMDDFSLERIVGDPQTLEVVKDLPIASIREILDRIDVYGKEEGLKKIEDVIARADLLKKEYSKL